MTRFMIDKKPFLFFPHDTSCRDITYVTGKPIVLMANYHAISSTSSTSSTYPKHCYAQANFDAKPLICALSIYSIYKLLKA